MVKEIALLRAIYQDSINGKGLKLSKQLIVPKVSYSDNTGCLHNEHWTYNVPYCFSDALDLRFIQFKKNNVCFTQWVQGCVLKFNEGDFFESSMGGLSVQVVSAKPVVINFKTWAMDEGEVVYQFFDRSGLGDLVKVSQFEFLERLIYGMGTQ